MNSRIFLMGMPGCGKSTLGKRIASRLNLSFIDLDEYIVASENKSIELLFAQSGEAGFRDLESHYLREIMDKHEKLLLSLGGGTPCFNNNLDYIQRNGLSVYLKMSAEALFHRVKNAVDVRPLFSGLDDEALLNKLQELLTKREPYYSQASLTLSGLSVNIEDAVHQVLLHLTGTNAE